MNDNWQFYITIYKIMKFIKQAVIKIILHQYHHLYYLLIILKST